MNGNAMLVQEQYDAWRADRVRDAELQRLIREATAERRSWFRPWRRPSTASEVAVSPAVPAAGQPATETVVPPYVLVGVVDLRTGGVPAPRQAPADKGVAQVGR